MRLLPVALIVVLALAIAGAPKVFGRSAIDLGAREKPTHEHTKAYSAAVEGASTIPVGQYRIIAGDFIVQVSKIERLTQYPFQGSFTDPLTQELREQGKYLIKAAEGHEFLRYEIEFQHLFGCSGVGQGVGTGVSVALVHQDGYDSTPADVSVIEGTCSVDPNEKKAVDWRARGVCQFYYDKAWKPQYLVLGEIDLNKGIDRPAAKIAITD